MSSLSGREAGADSNTMFGFSSSGFSASYCLCLKVSDLLQETYSDPGFTAFAFDFSSVCQACAGEKDEVGLD